MDSIKDSDRILKKIKKLMKLSKSANPHESANAIKKINSFMEKYKISQESIDVIDVQEVVSGVSPNNADKPPEYFAFLLYIIEKAFGVKAYWDFKIRTSYRYGIDIKIKIIKKRVIHFYGLNEKVLIAKYVYEVLARQLKSARKEYISSLSDKHTKHKKTLLADAFCNSFCIGVEKEIQELAMSKEEMEILEKYQKIQGVEKAVLKQDNNDDLTHSEKSSAYLKGMAKGKSIKLYNPVDGEVDLVKVGNEKLKLSSF